VKNRYKVRMYESGDGDGGVAAGTIVLSIDRGFSLDAASIGEVRQKLSKAVIDGELPDGRVYQISPAVGAGEPVQVIAFGEHADGRPVTLEPAMGLYSQFRRLRYAEAAPAPQTPAADPELVPA
jgi:hypothetical protein